jgi:cytochrome c biogenesis protein CcdA
VHLHRDVIAGTLFVLIGVFAVLVARAYPAGSAMRMGPGYFPLVLGWLLIVLGAWVGLRAFRRRDWEKLIALMKTKPDSLNYASMGTSNAGPDRTDTA